MNKKAFLLVSMSTLAATAACFSILTATISWFRTFENQEISGGGSTFNSYFAGGDGSEADPYQISNSTQMYNLAWLQYMGVFNKDTDNNGVIDQQYYFVVNNDINMSGMVIPPIGTVKNPFLGNFNGNDYVISNLTVSNEIDTTQVTTDKIYYHPDGVTNLEGDTELGLYGAVRVLGFFGVVGTPRGLGYNLSYTYDTEVTVATNFYLDKATVINKTSTVLVGLVAGYLGAPEAETEDQEKVTIVHDVGVYQSSIGTAANTSGLSGTYGTTISKYSLIGDFADTIEWGEPESGDEVAFGGSIDMLTFVRRVNYMATNADTWTTTGSSVSASDNDFHINAYFQISSNKYNSGNYWWKVGRATQGSIAWLQEGTYLPINIDKETMGLNVDTETLVSKTTGGVTISNYSNSYYQSSTSIQEIVSDTNTGYVVGGGTGGSNANGGNTAMRAKIDYAGGIYRSVGGLTTSSGKITVGTNVEPILRMVTYIGQNQKYVILDNQNINGTVNASLTDNFSNSAMYNSDTLNLQRYVSVKANISNTLSKTGMMHSIGPVAYLPSTISDTYIYNATNVKINDSTGKLNYPNYQFVKGGINCSLRRQGYLTTVIGSSSTSSNQFGFDLFKVTRNNSGNITGYEQVNNVCYNANTDTSIINSIASGAYKEVYNKDWYSSLLAYVAYYLEIPLPAGDYVLGDSSSHGTTNLGSYFLYLDIGANGGGTTPTTSLAYNIENVRFVAAVDRMDDYTDIIFTLSFAAATHGEGSVYFKHNGLTADQELVLYTYTTFTVEPNEGTRVSQDTSASVWNNTL